MEIKRLRVRVFEACLIGISLFGVGCSSVNPALEMRRQADAGDVEAMRRYATMATFSGNEIGEIDSETALQYFLKAAEQGDSRSGVFAAQLLECGTLPEAPNMVESRNLNSAYLDKLASLYDESKDSEIGYLLAMSKWEETPSSEAIEQMNHSARMLYYPAIIALAEYNLRQLNSSVRVRNEAINRLRHASQRGYAQADYLLYKSFKSTDTILANQYLEKSAKKKYPSALFQLGADRGDLAMIAQAAKAGFGEALLYLAKSNYYSSDVERQLAIKSAYAKGVKAAATLLLEEYLASKQYGAGLGVSFCMGESTPFQDLLDNHSGLYYPIKLTWQNEDNFNLLSEDGYRCADLYLAGVPAGLTEYKATLAENAYGSFLNSDWAYFVGNNLSGEWLEACFSAWKPYQYMPEYWLNYSLAAAACGQGEASLYGVYRLKGFTLAEEYLAVIALIEANGYMLLAKEDIAYAKLLEFGKLDNDNEHLKNLVRKFLPMMLKYPQRFLLSSGLEIEAESYSLVEKMPFYDVVLEQIITNESQWQAPINMVEVPLAPLVVGE